MVHFLLTHSNSLVASAINALWSVLSICKHQFNLPQSSRMVLLYFFFGQQNDASVCMAFAISHFIFILLKCFGCFIVQLRLLEKDIYDANTSFS